MSEGIEFSHAAVDTDPGMPAPPASCPAHRGRFQRGCSDCRDRYDEQIARQRERGPRGASEPTPNTMPRHRTRHRNEGRKADYGTRPGIGTRTRPDSESSSSEVVTPIRASQVRPDPSSGHPDASQGRPGRVPMDNEPRSLLSGMVSGSWLDAQEFPPLEWLVEGILPEGFGLLVAPPKAGKSWMVAGIGLACAAGGYALGKIVVKQRPVLYLALEDGHRRLQSRFRTLTEGEPIPDRMHVIISARPAEVPGMIGEFLHLHRAEKPLVVLDTLGKVKPPKQSGQEAYAADYAIGTRLKELVDSVPGSCLVAVHHTRKAESADFVDAVSGTQGIAGSADFILVLARKRKDDQAVLSVTGRDVPENEYALVTEEGRWRLDGMDLVDAAATVDRRRESKSLGDRSIDVLAHVATNGPTTPRDIADALGIDNKTASVYLTRLYDNGRIAKTKRGTYDRLPTGVESVESDEKGE